MARFVTKFFHESIVGLLNIRFKVFIPLVAVAVFSGGDSNGPLTIKRRISFVHCISFMVVPESKRDFVITITNTSSVLIDVPRLIFILFDRFIGFRLITSSKRE